MNKFNYSLQNLSVRGVIFPLGHLPSFLAVLSGVTRFADVLQIPSDNPVFTPVLQTTCDNPQEEGAREKVGGTASSDSPTPRLDLF